MSTLNELFGCEIPAIEELQRKLSSNEKFKLGLRCAASRFNELLIEARLNTQEFRVLSVRNGNHITDNLFKFSPELIEWLTNLVSISPFEARQKLTANEIKAAFAIPSHEQDFLLALLAEGFTLLVSCNKVQNNTAQAACLWISFA